MLDVALLIITLTSGGELRMSLTESPSLQACLGTQATIVGVLKQRDIKVLEARCSESPLALTPYGHGARDEDYQHYYRVTLLPEQAYQLSYLTPPTRCQPKPVVAKGKRDELCVVASQVPLP